MGRAQWLKGWLTGGLVGQGVLFWGFGGGSWPAIFCGRPFGANPPVPVSHLGMGRRSAGVSICGTTADVLLCLRWLRDRLEMGGRSEEVLEIKQHDGILFQSDAKAVLPDSCTRGRRW